jgi:hypothetical protein
MTEQFNLNNDIFQKTQDFTIAQPLNEIFSFFALL